MAIKYFFNFIKRKRAKVWGPDFSLIEGFRARGRKRSLLALKA